MLAHADLGYVAASAARSSRRTATLAPLGRDGAALVRESPGRPYAGTAASRDAGGTPRLGERARAAMRVKHLSPRTEEAYLGWMRRYHEFNVRKDPATLGAAHVTAFLNVLATERKVAASTQNQALRRCCSSTARCSAWSCLGSTTSSARGAPSLPAVLSREEVRAVLAEMHGVPRLMATMLYGAGLRLLECCRLRVKDVDFGRRQILVRRGKGDKDRVTMLPAVVADELASNLARVREQHRRDVERGGGWVELPDALARKLPSVGREWPWQWVFPATRGYVERETGQQRRHPLHETVLQQAVRRAVLASGIAKRATCHTLRHSFATHLLEMAATSAGCRSCSATAT